MNTITEVAVGIIFNSRGQFLLASRPEGKPYAGYWEFPGGKLEPNETPQHALARELHEELGITVDTALPWFQRQHTYPHATVRLHFYRVTAWHGTLTARENQHFTWVMPNAAPQVEPILPANDFLLKALTLPHEYLITCTTEFGIDTTLQRLEKHLQRGISLIQIREPQLDNHTQRTFIKHITAMCHAASCKVLLNGAPEAAQSYGLDGVHLNRHLLSAHTQRPQCEWVGASVHNAAELAHAAAIGCDFVVLGAVAPTQSHPNTPPLGWQQFAQLTQTAQLPVYALGGLTPAQLSIAQHHGAHGISYMREAWRYDPV